jgi:hypothetical protein
MSWKDGKEINTSTFLTFMERPLVALLAVLGRQQAAVQRSEPVEEALQQEQVLVL